MYDVKETAAGYLPYYLAQKGIDVSKKFTCLNPEHLDHTPSMMYDSHRNKCHCFSCGADVDVFDLISWDYNTSGFAETLKVACDLFGINTDKKLTPPKQKKITGHKNTKPAMDVKVLDRTYRALRDLCPLTKEDIRYLSEVRGIPEDQAKERYFRTVADDRGRADVCRKLKKLTGYSTDVLKSVPGFFTKDGALDYTSESGIGILIRNIDQDVTSVQIRRDTADKGNRYCWFSSKFAADSPEYGGGASPGSQKDILIPSNPKKAVCLTEGRFKSEILASYRNISVSIQGVSSWRGIDDVLGQLMERYGVKTAFLMFDADILGNYQVLQNIQKMSKSIHAKLPELKLISGIWKIQYGKGIDDCILSGNMDMVRYIDTDTMLGVCAGTYREIMKKYGRNIQPSVLRDTLQQANEEIFFGTPKAA